MAMKCLNWTCGLFGKRSAQRVSNSAFVLVKNSTPLCFLKSGAFRKEIAAKVEHILLNGCGVNTMILEEQEVYYSMCSSSHKT